MCRIRLGINNAFAAKRWHRPDDWCGLIASTLGLTEVQVSFDTIEPSLPEPARSACADEVRTASRRHNLTLRSTFTGAVAYGQSLFGHPHEAVRTQARDWYTAAVKMTARLGAEMTGGHMGALDIEATRDSRRYVKALSTVIDAVVWLARRASKSGLNCLLWELMPSASEPPHHPKEAEAILSEVNALTPIPVRLCLDLGHCCASDLPAPGDPEEWLRRLLPWTRMVHLQQTDGTEDRHWPFTPAYNSRGIIDPRSIIEIVYDSPEDTVDLVFEFAHPMTAPPRQVVNDYRQSIELWCRFL